MNSSRFFSALILSVFFPAMVFCADFPVMDSSVFSGFYDPYNTQLIGNTRNSIAVSGGLRNYDFGSRDERANYHESWAGACVTYSGFSIAVSYPRFGDRISDGGVYMDDGFILSGGFRLSHLNAIIGASVTVPLGFETKSEGVALNAAFATKINDYVMPFISMKNVISNGYTIIMDDESYFASVGWPFTADAGIVFTPFETLTFTLKGTGLLAQKQLIPISGSDFAIPVYIKPGLAFDVCYRTVEWLEISAGISGSEKMTSLRFQEYSSRLGYKAGLGIILPDNEIRLAAESDSRPVSGMPLITLTMGQYF